MTCVLLGRRSNMAPATVGSVYGWVAVDEEPLKPTEVREESL